MSTDVLGLPGHASFSSVKTYSSCGEKYRLQKLVGVEEEPSGALIGGKAVHAVIDHAYKSGEVLEALLDFFVGYITEDVEDAGGKDAVRWGGRKSKAAPNGEDFDWWTTVGGPAMLNRAAELIRRDLEQGRKLIASEPDFGFQLGDRFVKAYPDAVLSDGKALIIRDFKTGVMVPPDGGLQLGYYALAARQRYTEMPFDTVLGEIVMLRQDDWAKRVITYQPDLYADVVTRMVRDFFAGTEEGLFAMNPGLHCTSMCGVRAQCEFGKTLTTTEEEN